MTFQDEDDPKTPKQKSLECILDSPCEGKVTFCAENGCQKSIESRENHVFLRVKRHCENMMFIFTRQAPSKTTSGKCIYLVMSF